jgi:hypothetical protein
VASLEDVKARLYSFNISIAMLAVDTVELGLQRQTGGFFLIEGNLSCPRVASKVTHVEFNMLSSKVLLITLELEKFFTVDDGTAPATSRCASSARRCQGDTRMLSID